MRRILLFTLVVAVSGTSSAIAYTQQRMPSFAIAQEADFAMLKKVYLDATPLNFSQINSMRKAGLCKSIFNGQLVVSPTAFIATAELQGVRFGDYVHPSYPDLVDTGKSELYRTILDQAVEIVRDYGLVIRTDHLHMLKEFPDNKALARSTALNDILIRLPKTSYGSRYPLQHPSLSGNKAVAYPVSVGVGGEIPTLVGRVEYRQTVDGMIIAGFQSSVEASIWSRARKLESLFLNSEPSLICFWYEDVGL